MGPPARGLARSPHPTSPHKPVARKFSARATPSFKNKENKNKVHYFSARLVTAGTLREKS